MQQQPGQPVAMMQAGVQQPGAIAPGVAPTAGQQQLVGGYGMQAQPQQQWQHKPPQQQQQAQPPQISADILGLADKAASAIAALGQNKPLMQVGGMPGQLQGQQPQHPGLAQYGQPTAMQQPAQQQQRQQQASSQPQQSVSESELPMMVGYALQNLRATGHVEGALDPDVCRMLKQLPEHQALQALERFSSCDQSTMRNKTAYLRGVLRRFAD
uniref:Heterogeneous nuclear ribonucleoprotein Q acidic domain-containing protein n=1 Tax=Odontella aurita TaxID=265563 RepID=A0A7S4II47_9STRA